MAEKIVINPVTRIEGHAKVSIFLKEDGKVQEARFEIVDFRGFEKFTEGRPFYEMPSITSRSCGICPVSHLLASAKACDQIASVKITKTAENLRRLMHNGQMIQSHALNFFHLSSPDLMLGLDSDPAKRNIFGLIEKYPEIAKQGIKLRKFGQQIIEFLSGKRIHSSDWIVPGGVKYPFTKEKQNRLLADLPEALDIATKTLETFKKSLPEYEDEIADFGNFPTYYLSLITQDGGLEHYDGEIRIKGPNGNIIEDRLDPTKYLEYIGEACEPWSYMKFPYYKPLGYPDGIYRVGPLARLNVSAKCGTPIADDELNEFKKLGRNGVVESTFMYHYARLIEIIFCVERTKQMLEDSDILKENVWVKSDANQNEGVGVAEAPRGTLFHHYKVDDLGRITWVNMIIATENNNLAYNKAVTQVAKKYVVSSKLAEGMLNRVEAVIRAFDPCLSCATHAWGEMPLSISLYSSKGKLLDNVTR
ncbi:MAG: Ni/Fe hydrogenase subunit alpha [Nitrososphaeria archaeon]|jgi:NAD-reducing hydrogenase large subunit